MRSRSKANRYNGNRPTKSNKNQHCLGFENQDSKFRFESTRGRLAHTVHLKIEVATDNLGFDRSIRKPLRSIRTRLYRVIEDRSQFESQLTASIGA
ncbi:hypothetical protein Acr_19g0004450 [Actinidia rufa]|uniref:Uncharacterized protein n=1 Tax=Actinidia rufa TaxID=165716 RepID=A0A7J0G9X4_9ERIC|nr:hypothetical protein Acr_19g0004450 [Actinidia rufa]